MSHKTNIMRKTTLRQLCDVIGCHNPASVRVIPQFKAPTLCMCEQCKPDPGNRPAELQEFPFAYSIEPLTHSPEFNHHQKP